MAKAEGYVLVGSVLYAPGDDLPKDAEVGSAPSAEEAPVAAEATADEAPADTEAPAEESKPRSRRASK